MQPQLFGILNITEDSFSDGGRFLAPEAARAQAEKLIANGAEALDVGAASSNVNSIPVPPEVEIARLEPIIAFLKERGIPISIDSYATAVQSWALNQGVDYLNDIHGFADPVLYPKLAASGAKLIVMHAVQESGPATRVDTDPARIMEQIFSFFDQRLSALHKAGIARERIILDPGMGQFLGRDPEVSLTVLRRLPDMAEAFGLPILISVSRKGFLRRLTGRPVSEIGPATLAAELFAALSGADMVRTHDPGALRDVLTIWRALSPRP
jgi:dihydropteroate synthase type 2